jgi:CHASE1-domain containing sensor protein
MASDQVLSAKTKKFFFFHILPLFIVLILGAVITYRLYLFVQNSQEKVFENYFRINARERISAIRHEIEMVISPVKLMEAYFAASQSVEEEEFASFTHPILSSYEEITGLAWVEKKVKNIEAVNQRGMFGYEISFIQPYPLMKEFKGMDLSEILPFSEILKETQDKGREVSRFIDPVKAVEQNVNLVIAVPFYEAAKHPILKNERRRMLTGFIIELIDFNKLVEKALRFFPLQEVNIKILKMKNEGKEALLYTNYKSAEGEALAEVPFQGSSKDKIYESRVITMEDEKIQVICFPSTNIFRHRFMASQMVLQMGAFLTLLTTWILHLLLTRTESVQRQVDERTQELKVRTEEAIRAYLRLKPEIEERKSKEEELKKAVKELKRVNEELEKFNKLMVGRELKMMELKKKLFEREQG